MADDLSCFKCGHPGAEAVVQGGSYLLRCELCGEGIVVTSFMALKNLDEGFAAFADPGAGGVPGPDALIAEGRLCEIYDAISKYACTHGPVLLRSRALQGP